MASPSDIMPGKRTQQEVELRCGFYTTQFLQQLEQSPELANLRKLKKERLAQHARKMKAAMFFFLAFAVMVCAYCGTRNHLQVHSFRLIFASWCCCYLPGVSAKHPTAAKHQKSIQWQSTFQCVKYITPTAQVSHRRNITRTSFMASRLLSLWSSSTLKTRVWQQTHLITSQGG